MINIYDFKITKIITETHKFNSKFKRMVKLKKPMECQFRKFKKVLNTVLEK